MKPAMLLTLLALVMGCGPRPDAAAYAAELVGSNMGPGMGMGGPSPEHLGYMLFFDPGLSLNANQACAGCHGAEVGWTGGDESINLAGGVYEGSVAERFGNRKPPSSAYAMRSPLFTFDAQNGFSGGNFSDGRATGWVLGSAVADQARGPFLNPVEQALPDASALLQRVCSAHYGRMFSRVWGADACSDVDQGYAAIARSVAAFESSAQVSPYSSKYDAVLRGQQQLTADEQHGLELFNGKAHCSVCHASTVAAGGEPPVFSDFGFDNIGVPKNPANPFYRMDRVEVNGAPINPDGADWIDPGLGGFVESLAADEQWRSEEHVPSAMLALSAGQLSQLAGESRGKHRVPTLRNVDRRPSPGFVKAYTHNGYFKTLSGLVHFYNTRDILPRCAHALSEQEALAEGCWPAPEVEQGVDARNIGDLGLSATEEQALLAFLSTLSDEASATPMMHGMHGGGMHGRH